MRRKKEFKEVKVSISENKKIVTNFRHTLKFDIIIHRLAEVTGLTITDIIELSVIDFSDKILKNDIKEIGGVAISELHQICKQQKEREIFSIKKREFFSRIYFVSRFYQTVYNMCLKKRNFNDIHEFILLSEKEILLYNDKNLNKEFQELKNFKESDYLEFKRRIETKLIELATPEIKKKEKIIKVKIENEQKKRK